MIGETVGSYRIVDRIAVGGMGTVFRAEHALIGRVAAVKVLHPEMSGNREVVNRFFNEAKATTTIKHPGIVEIFDFGYMPSGHAFLVMEFLEGEPLSERMRNRGPMAEGEAAMMLRGVCSALAAAHAKGIVHRDLKPDNIYVVPDADAPLGERTKILDFGIAKLTDIGLAGSNTKTGAVMGTPTYMSPEQCRGSGDVDHRADLYSIGCILYELIAGRPPFVNSGAGELIGSHLFVEPEPPSRHVAVTPELEGLIMSLLSKRPELRVQTAVELAQRLVAIAQQHGWIAISSTDPASRMSMQQIVPPGGMTASRPMITPAFPTPLANQAANASFGATQMAPPSSPGWPTPTPTPMPTPLPSSLQIAPKPTTLSGAASQTIPPASRSRRGLMIGGAFVLALGAAIAVFAGLSGSKASKTDDTAVSPAGAPVTSPTPVADPTPTPVATPTPVPVATPVPTPVPTPTPVADPTPVPVADPTPTSTPTTTVTKPTKPAGTTAKPTKPTKPTGTTAKPTKLTKPTKPDKPTKPGGDLLETDL